MNAEYTHRKTTFRIVNVTKGVSIIWRNEYFPQAFDVYAAIGAYNNDVIVIEQVEWIGRDQRSTLVHAADRNYIGWQEVSKKQVASNTLRYSKKNGWFWQKELNAMSIFKLA
jgi:hypothetical protein